MGESFEVCWDWGPDGNVAHIAEHDVTPDEVEQVLEDGFDRRVPDRVKPERWIVFGFTANRRYLKVVIDLDWADEWACWAVYPVTAFEPD